MTGVSIVATVSELEAIILRTRVALLELAEDLETASQRGRPDESVRIREIAALCVAPSRGACSDHPAAETVDVISCVTCGAWKPSKDSPLVYIGSDGVHRAVRALSTPPPPAPDEPAEPIALRSGHVFIPGTDTCSVCDLVVRNDVEPCKRRELEPHRNLKAIEDSPDLQAAAEYCPCGACAPAVEKASVPDQEIARAAAAENKGAATPASAPLSDQQCECREKDHGNRCPMPATHRISKLGGYFFYCADCTAFRVPHAERIDGSGVVDELDYRRPCPNHDEPAR